jgi:hypothetical protein
MAAWTLIPCLVALRDEFNAVAPGRQRGADGSIGDSSHTSSSDHTPDEDSDFLRDHDADSKNEVHALDIDSDGPWPDGSGREAGGWFDRTIKAIAEQERREYLSADVYGRLQYIIWRGRIISRSWGWSEWRTYTGASKHFDHAHLSARYLTRTEADTRPWGVEDDVALTEDDKKWLAAEIDKAATRAAERVWASRFDIETGPDKTYMATAGSILLHIPGEHARTEKAIAEVATAVAELDGAGTMSGTLTVTGGQITVTTGANE